MEDQDSVIPEMSVGNVLKCWCLFLMDSQFTVLTKMLNKNIFVSLLHTDTLENGFICPH